MTAQAPHIGERRALRVVALSVITALTIAIGAAAPAFAAEGSYQVRFPGERPSDGPLVHVVEPGEYLSTIAIDHGLDRSRGWRSLYDANPSIQDPDLIVAGQEVLIPQEGETLTARALPGAQPSHRQARGQDGDDRAADAGAAESTPAANAGTADGVWDRLARCEAGGDWSINTGNGYYGGLQFDKSSWDWAGGDAYAAYPHQATRQQQIAVAEQLRSMHPAGWGAWPACARQLGLD